MRIYGIIWGDANVSKQTWRKVKWNVSAGFKIAKRVLKIAKRKVELKEKKHENVKLKEKDGPG